MREFTNMPDSIRTLPRDRRGYPVPAFVHWIDGEPDFRIISPTHMVDCVTNHKCWICGQPIREKTCSFVLGPMCAVNRINSEPPSHNACAVFAGINCPFLAHPKMKRNERDMPAVGEIAGIHLDRNPGCCLVWQTVSYTPQVVDNGVLFVVGDPVRLDAFAEGRRATRQEVRESVRTGMPHLVVAAEQDGPLAMMELYRMLDAANALFDKWIKPATAAA
jgi:hypothetical protein